jgi:2-(1,2-epoxy-1,2-dihydrophenyl)acetyl-CoA isomerase
MTMGNDAVTCSVADGVATVTLNRPDALNAFTIPMMQELHRAMLACDEDPNVRCVVLTGAGRAFCAGGDVREFLEKIDHVGTHIRALTAYHHAIVSLLARMPKPTVAAVNGVVAGGGIGLALGCDLVLASESARFSMAYSRIGASPDGGSTYFLPRLVGLRRALELSLTNRSLTAREACEWGLFTRVIPDSEFRGAVAALARELAQGPTLAFAKAKRLLHMNAEMETQMEQEARWIAESSHTEDFREAVKAFGEKRPPNFKGR